MYQSFRKISFRMSLRDFFLLSFLLDFFVTAALAHVMVWAAVMADMGVIGIAYYLVMMRFWRTVFAARQLCFMLCSIRLRLRVDSHRIIGFLRFRRADTYDLRY